MPLTERFGRGKSCRPRPAFCQHGRMSTPHRARAWLRLASRLALSLFLVGCATLPRSTPPEAAPAPAVDRLDQANQELQQGRRSGAKATGHELPWQEFGASAFAQAKQDGRLLLLDCVATWCHWCHVMDETTYRDPQVQALLRQHFIVLRADVDARPDLSARYENWGWPATVILTPEGAELGKFRGYLRPQELLSALHTALSARTQDSRTAPSAGGLIEGPLPLTALTWLGPQLFLRLDQAYDEEAGGWGQRHKMALGAHIEVELRRAAHGDAGALARVRQTLQAQRALYDPVWGGVYQYSTGGGWDHPHFEKLLPFQTRNIEALARAFKQTGERSYLDDALRIADYLQRFLLNEVGAFGVSQDADLGGFEGHGRFVDGHEYFRLDDAGRRALGIPRVDRSVYPQENGLAIAALATLAQVVPDRTQAQALFSQARRAADYLLAERVDSQGAVSRSRGSTPAPRFLADAAALARGLLVLASVTGDSRYRQSAQRILGTLLNSFAVHPSELGISEPREASVLLRATTKDPGAVGVFAARQQPFDENVLLARALLALGDPASSARARQILAALSSPHTLAERGLMLAEYLLALDDAGLLRWRK